MKLYWDMDGVINHFIKDGDYLREGYFYGLPVHEEIKKTIDIFNEEKVEQFILSKYPNKTACFDKMKSIVELFPWFKRKNIILLPYEDDKTKYVGRIDKNDILIDDFTPNLVEWQEIGGTPIKCINKINNTTGRWKGDFIDVGTNPYDIVKKIVGIIERRL